MIYRRLGSSGLKVSALSYGSWITFDQQNGLENIISSLSVAREGGVNFFDCAEIYAGGRAERILGEAIRELGWSRDSYIISTKFYFGLAEGVNSRRTLNRKYLLSAIDGSLERLGHDVVDIVLCHRPDPETPIEEVVVTMSDIISRGKALYWGVSEWPAKSIRRAYEIAKRNNLRAPVTEQPEYNLINRSKVEREFKDLYKDFGIGLTTWSPLAEGVLTGKYLDGIPTDSRAAKPDNSRIRAQVEDESLKSSIRALQTISVQLGCSLAQLAIAWCLRNPRVSTVITGASRASQVRENLGALDVLARLDDEIVGRINGLFPRNAELRE
ncbi:MAG TPA: aldo/keto reductase [Acidimicrobiales bacterium]|nr:aldo/keto reductase [Acidimicrobiales bacterium]